MGSDWQHWLYVAACVVVPGLWGGLVAWWFARRDRAIQQPPKRPDIDYMI